MEKEKSNKLLTIVIVIIVLISGIFYLIMPKEENNNNNIKEEKTLYDISETISCYDFDITVEQVNYKYYGDKVLEIGTVGDKMWVGAIITIKNTSKYENQFNSRNITLQNDNGEIISVQESVFKVWGNYDLLNNPTLISGASKTGFLQFNNNTDKKENSYLIIDCDDALLSQSTKYKVKL